MYTATLLSTRPSEKECLDKKTEQKQKGCDLLEEKKKAHIRRPLTFKPSSDLERPE